MDIPNKKVMVFADTREFSSDVIKHLETHNCNIRQKMLHVADYICSDRVGIERKSSSDFLSSIVDKRLFKQVKALKENFEKPVLIIEGNDLYGRLHPNIIKGTLASLAIDYAIPIIWTNNVSETAGIIYWIAKREQFEDNRKISIRNDKKITKLSEKQEFLISGLPGVNVIRAQSLLDHFKKPENIFSAQEEDLLNVEGIGKKTAKSIKDLLVSEYE